MKKKAMMCLDHPCDNCAVCAAGGCCGESVVTLNLPQPGAYPCADGTELGRLSVVGGLALCHLCGEGFRALGGHIGPAHGMSADEYRSAFDLLSTRGLRAEKRAATWTGGNPEALSAWNMETTTEQRALIQFHRARRGESANPRLNRTKQAEFAAIGAAARRGTVLGAAVRIKCRLAKRREDPGRTCPECGTVFCTWSTRRNPKAATCGQPACIRSAKQRAAKKRWGI